MNTEIKVGDEIWGREGFEKGLNRLKEQPMKQSDRWTDKGIENAIKEATNKFNRTAIINGSYDIYQCPEHWMEKMWFTRIVFKLYHKIRNWIIINL